MMRYKLLFLLLALTSLCVKAATDERSNVITSNTAEATVTFSTGSTYEWEWDATNRRLRSTNYHQPSTTSQTTITITNSSECYLSFDYSASSESNYDKLTITLDGTTIVNAISGTESSSYSKKVAVGTHTLVMKYVKDGSVDSNDDRAYVKNLQLGDDILSGKCGTNVTWTLNTETGLLCIKGSGEMNNFSSANNVPWCVNRSYVKKIEIEHGITTIGDRAFYNCSNISDITIPESVTNFGEYAFYGCSSLESITIPNSVTSIGARVFSGCSRLESITIPNSVTTIGNYAFYGCSALSSITIPESVTTIGDDAFSRCTSLPVEDNLRYADTYLIEAVDQSCTTYTIKQGTRFIGSYAFFECSALSSITIPNSVTSIGASVFFNCSSLESITIPNSVTNIGDDAFNYCHTLSSITIPESVTSIGDYAFYDCSTLSSITIPKNVTSIGRDAFYNCFFKNGNFTNNSSLSSEEHNYWGATMAKLELDNGLLINDTVIVNCRKWATSVTIPEYVTVIGNSAFAYCSTLSSITIPEGVVSIGNSAFSSCSSLTSITIPEGVMSIGDSAFSGCSSLTSITIPESVTEISNAAFDGCSGLTSITIPNSVTSIGTHAFYNCTSLTDLISLASTPPSLYYHAFDSYNATVHVLPGCGDAYRAANSWKNFTIVEDAVTNPSGTCGDNARWTLDLETEHLSITGTGAMTDYNMIYMLVKKHPWYDYAKSIKSISVASGITSIGNCAFKDCTSLTSITIPEGVTSIGAGAFKGCSSLVSIAIPESVTSIGSDAFSDCSALASINIPESVTSIGSDAFSGCTSLPVEDNLRYADTYLVEAIDKSLTTYTIKQGTRFIGQRAFSSCSALASINIPESVTIIGSGAFAGCSSLTSLNIPENVTIIESYAFAECSALTSITIPESVTSIGTYAFTRCSALTSITIPKNATGSSTGFFSGCTALTSVELPEGLGRIGTMTFEGCSALSQFTIPSTVESIGDMAFEGCTSLTDLISLASTPPSLEYDVFDSYNATLHVLPGGKGVYEADDEWKNFTNIVEDAGLVQTDIARIDDATYPSLAEAISAASTMKNPVIEMIGVDDATDLVSLSNATLIFPEGTSYAGQITINAGGVLDMQGGSINVSNNEAVHVNSGTLRMSAGSISTSMANKDALYVRNDGKAYIAGGTLTGTRYAMMINGDTSRSGVVEVTGGEFVRLMTGANNNSHSSVIYNWDASYAPVGCMRLSYDESHDATLALTEDYEALAEGKWAFDTFPMAMSTNYKNITLTREYVADADREVRKNLTIGETGVYTGNMTVYNTYSLTIEGKVNGKVAGYSGSVININGGSVTATDNTSAVEIRSALNMTGGEVTNLSDASNSAAIIIKEKATSVNIEDGVFTGVKGLATDANISVSQFVHGGKFSNDVTKLANVVEEGLVTTQLPVEGYYTLVKVSDAEADDKTLTINFPVDAVIYNAILDQYPNRQFSYIDMSGDEAYTADDVVLKNATHTNDNTLYNVKNETFAGQTNVICNGSANDISLTYGYPYVMPLQIDDVARISYTRNYTVADWSDLYLPFDIPAGSVDYRLAEIWDTEVAKTDGNGSAVSIEFVTLDNEDILQANTPAIIKPLEAGENTIVVENTTLYPSMSNSIACSTTKEEFEFRGVYDNTTLLDKKAWFFQASTQQFRFVSSPTAYLQSFRFYMTIADKSTNELLYGKQAPNMVRFQVIGDDETSINNISDAEIENSDLIYDMSGRRVNGMQKGVYIINGKKTIINK